MPADCVSLMPQPRAAEAAALGHSARRRQRRPECSRNKRGTSSLLPPLRIAEWAEANASTYRRRSSAATSPALNVRGIAAAFAGGGRASARRLAEEERRRSAQFAAHVRCPAATRRRASRAGESAASLPAARARASHAGAVAARGSRHRCQSIPWSITASPLSSSQARGRTRTGCV